MLDLLRELRQYRTENRDLSYLKLGQRSLSVAELKNSFFL